MSIWQVKSWYLFSNLPCHLILYGVLDCTEDHKESGLQTLQVLCIHSSRIVLWGCESRFRLYNKQYLLPRSTSSIARFAFFDGFIVTPGWGISSTSPFFIVKWGSCYSAVFFKKSCSLFQCDSIRDIKLLMCVTMTSMGPLLWNRNKLAARVASVLFIRRKQTSLGWSCTQQPASIHLALLWDWSEAMDLRLRAQLWQNQGATQVCHVVSGLERCTRRTSPVFLLCTLHVICQSTVNALRLKVRDRLQHSFMAADLPHRSDVTSPFSLTEPAAAAALSACYLEQGCLTTLKVP